MGSEGLREGLEDIRSFVAEETAREGAGFHFAISQVRVLDYIDIKLAALAAQPAAGEGLRLAEVRQYVANNLAAWNDPDDNHVAHAVADVFQKVLNVIDTGNPLQPASESTAEREP
jgi:hypothetical protein